MEHSQKKSKDCNKKNVCKPRKPCDGIQRERLGEKAEKKPYICPNIACGSSQAYNPFTALQMQKTFNIEFPVPMGTPVSDVVRAYSRKPIMRRDFNYMMGISIKLLTCLRYLLDIKVISGMDPLAKEVKAVIIEYYIYFGNRQMEAPKPKDMSPEDFWKNFFKNAKEREEALNSSMPEFMESPHPTSSDKVFDLNRKIQDLIGSYIRQKPSNSKILSKMQIFKMTMTEMRHLVLNLQPLSELMYMRICNGPAIETIMRIHSWVCEAMHNKTVDQKKTTDKFYEMVNQLVKYLESV